MRRLLACFALLLTACAGQDDGGGGSGGGGSTFDPGPRSPLPAAWSTLDYYFGVELIDGTGFTGTSHNMPVKLAVAPDGRLFASVLDGSILVYPAAAPYTPAVFATLPVLAGSEQGLLGIALSPAFATDHYVYVMACVPNGMGNRQQVIRYTESGGVGTSPTVIVDNLPTGNTHNAGGLVFGADGKLYVSVGDVGTDTNSQTSGSLAGRVLRFNPDGTAPTDNPLAAPDQFEYCRGLRNPFGMCVDGAGGSIVVSENGPNSNDELNFIRPGKNFEWGATSPVPGAQVGFRMRNWPTVIVPTGLTYHSGTDMPSASYARNIFLCSYEDLRIYRLEMYGSPPVNIGSEEVFGEFAVSGNANRPLDIVEGPGGDLYVSTFTQIWRIFRRTGP